MEHSLLQDIILLLGVSVLGVALFRRLNLPPVIAYLLIGLIIGPEGVALISSSETTHFIAEFGVVFLLFIIGLEFSMPKLLAMRNTVFVLGSTQVLICTLFFGLFAWLSDLSLTSSLIIGGILALSSTAVVTKQLVEQLELNSRHGRMTVGILLFQDLAVIPLLVVIPLLAGGSENSLLPTLSWALVKAVFIFLLLLAIGHWLLRPFLHEVARARSAELFTLSVLFIAMAAAWATDAAGLSLALGGFLAGMMLGETEYRHQIEADIRPFQDVLLGFFFITIGMLINLQVLAEIWHWVILFTVGYILFKAVIITLLAQLTGAEPGVAFRTGLMLAQGGEFGFALLALALGSTILDETTSQIILSVILLSMTVAPFMIRYNGKLAMAIYTTSYNRNRKQIAQSIEQDTGTLNKHVVICGYGRVGQSLAHLLEKEGIPFVALDLDPVRLREAIKAGERVHYGDATHRQILEATGLHNARLLIISLDDTSSTLKILGHCKQIVPDLPVLVRAKDDSQLERLQAAGATEVVPETVETSLMLGAQMLTLLQMPVSRIIRVIQDARSNRYQLLRAYFHGEEAVSINSDDSIRHQLHTVEVPEQAFAVNKTISDLGLDGLSVHVTAVRRGGIKGTEPSDDFIVQPGDVVVLYGATKSLYRAEEIILKG